MNAKLLWQKFENSQHISVAAFGIVSILVLMVPFMFWDGVPWPKASPPNEIKSPHVKRGTLEYHMTFLDSHNEERFEQAVYAARLDPEKALPQLSERLSASNLKEERLRSNILYIYGRIGEKAKKTMPEILPFLKNKNPDLRATAARALGRIGNNSAIGPLSALLRDKDTWVRENAIKALKDIDSPRARQALNRFVQN